MNNDFNINAKSVLRLDNIFCSRFTFERANKISDGGLDISFKHEMEINDKKYDVILSTSISNNDKTLNLFIELIGTFYFDDTIAIDDKLKDSLIKKNAVAILFPYMRSQITLLTSQPDMTPVILPPININDLLKSTT